jgi:hypothetical protein
MFLLVKYLLTAHFAVVSAGNIGGTMTTTAVIARSRVARRSAI